MEGHQPQAHQELGQQGTRHHLPGEEAEGGGAQGTALPAARIQGEEGDEKEVDEGAAQGEAEAEGTQRDQGWQVRNHQEYQEYQKVEQEDQESTSQTPRRDVRKFTKEKMILPLPIIHSSLSPKQYIYTLTPSNP